MGTDGACGLLFCAAKRSGAFPPNMPAGLTWSEVRRKIGRDNVVAEIRKLQNLGVPWRAYRLDLHKARQLV